MTIVFDGKKFAEEKEKRLKEEVSRASRVPRVSRGETGYFRPKLVAILVGDNPESELYLKLKQKAAERLGIDFEMKKFSGENPQEIIDFIEEKNNDSGTNGIIVELPLPTKLGKYDILDKIRQDKDVDCLTSENLKLLKEGHPKFVPPTVRAVGEILKYQRSNSKNQKGDKKIVVVGSKGMVGRGILSYLRYLGNLSNLKGIDQETKDLASVTKGADVLISATGIGHLIKKEMVKLGAIVIDVGIEKQPDGSLIGDVDFENVKEMTSFITPVPGGVGPVTVVCLMENLLQTMYH